MRRTLAGSSGDPRLEVLTWPGDRTGTSAPVVLVHGAWHGAWCWADGFGERLAAGGHDVHALSLRGHGRSEGTLLRSRIRDYVSDLRRVVGTLGRPPVLVGHSMGAFVVQKYLETDRVAGAVLLAPMPHTGVGPCMLRLLRTDPFAVVRMHATLGRNRLTESPATARRILFSANMPEAEVRRHLSRLGGEALLAYIDMLWLDLCRPRPGMVPMLVLGAGDDAMFTRQEVEAMAAAHGVPATFVPGIAHDMMLVPGWQHVADKIGAWVGRHSPHRTESEAASRPPTARAFVAFDDGARQRASFHTEPRP